MVLPVDVGSSRPKQEVRTLMTVMATGAARIQKTINVSTPVVSG